MRSGITRRWLRGSLLITVLLVLLVEVMFLYSATRSYYNGVQQTMYRRFSSITGQLKMYTGETSQKTCPCSRASMLRVQSGVQVFPGFPEPAFTSRYFLPEEKGRSLFVPAIFTVPHREPRSVGFP